MSYLIWYVSPDGRSQEVRKLPTQNTDPDNATAVLCILNENHLSDFETRVTLITSAKNYSAAV